MKMAISHTFLTGPHALLCPVHRWASLGALPCPIQACSICLCDVEDAESIKELSCGHFYHAPCLDSWLKVKDSCPACRQPVTAPTPKALRCKRANQSQPFHARVTVDALASKAI